MLESNVVEAILTKFADHDRGDRRCAFDLIVTLTKYGTLTQLVEVHVLNESQMTHVSRCWNPRLLRLFLPSLQIVIRVTVGMPLILLLH